MENFSKPFVNFSIHDVTLRTLPLVKEITSFLISQGISRFSLLLVPAYHGRESLFQCKEEIFSLCENREVILHGYLHKGPSGKRYFFNWFFTDGEGEFADPALKDRDLEEKLRKGLKILKEVGFSPRGFIPPAWLFPEEKFHILKKLGFLFTTNRRYVYDLKRGHKIFSPVLSFSSRNGLSFLSRLWVPFQAGLTFKKLSLIRIAIHPKDFEDKRKIEILRDLIYRLKKLGYTSEFLEKFINQNKKEEV